MILCEERIHDGTYHDVLALTASRVPKTQFILLVQVLEEAGERRDAGRLGVAEVIRAPFEPTDVELALIHVIGGQTAGEQAA